MCIIIINLKTYKHHDKYMQFVFLKLKQDYW